MTLAGFSQRGSHKHWAATASVLRVTSNDRVWRYQARHQQRFILVMFRFLCSSCMMYKNANYQFMPCNWQAVIGYYPPILLMQMRLGKPLGSFMKIYKNNYIMSYIIITFELKALLSARATCTDRRGRLVFNSDISSVHRCSPEAPRPAFLHSFDSRLVLSAFEKSPSWCGCEDILYAKYTK